MKRIIADLKREPTSILSALFLLFLILGFYLGWSSFATNKNLIIQYASAGQGWTRSFVKAFLLHTGIALIYTRCSESRNFFRKASIITAVIAVCCGIYIGKFYIVLGIMGLFSGFFSYFPHYVLLILMYKNLTEKILSGHIFSVTDKVKYVIIIIIISIVHVFVSASLAKLFI